MTWGAPHAFGDDKAGSAQPSNRVDATTLDQKVLCGYQGWFRCPGD